jgi:outer membrane lipoprotein SlyB
MTAFEVPEAGMLIAVGPIVGALSDAIAGGALGAVAGALVGIRLPERSAKVYEDMVVRGNVLISVQAEDAARRETAREIFRAGGAEQISDLD